MTLEILHAKLCLELNFVTLPILIVDSLVSKQTKAGSIAQGSLAQQEASAIRNIEQSQWGLFEDRQNISDYFESESSFDSPPLPFSSSISGQSHTSSAHGTPYLEPTGKEEEAGLLDFHEHSYALHKGIEMASLILPKHKDPALHSEASFSTSMEDEIEFGLSGSLSHSTAPRADIEGGSLIMPHGNISPVPENYAPLTNLEDIPSPASLLSIVPQTMTVNLVLRVITIASPRCLQTRRGGEVELVEMVVGDETRGDFRINFWLPITPRRLQHSLQTKEGHSSNQMGILLHLLPGIQPQDIIFLRNVALSVYNGNVYGQSLRRAITQLHLLYRGRPGHGRLRGKDGCFTAADLYAGMRIAGSQAGLLAKVRRIQDWILWFVAPKPLARKKILPAEDMALAASRRELELPQDTPD
ncbi:MAG: hypothetical protein M1829_001109 [Trizodia sp. TS-e1964]|nr:MAG: hypothetical protein M1829_001109 [Trizodia sp. TS-e1964]